MLSIDQIRVTLREGEIKPRWIREDHKTLLNKARDLINAFTNHIGALSGDLAEELKDIEGNSTNYQVLRGLAKLLQDRTKMETQSPLPPIELRRQIFQESARHYPVSRAANLLHPITRQDILKTVADSLGVSVAEVEKGLYADLKAQQVITSFKALPASDLLARYNVSLVQGILLRASEMTIDLHMTGRLSAAKYRQFFRHLKFHQLLHTIAPKATGGYRITIDGPTSVLKSSGKYGFQMACFFPALLLCNGWRMEAQVHWGTKRERCIFKLSSEQGLRSHYQEKGMYLREEEQMFIDRFEALKSPWEVQRDEVLVPLGGQGLLIPDFRLRHREDGREATFEIMGYWRAEYLRRRLDLLVKEGPSNLVLAISDRMRTDAAALDELPMEVIFFKKVIRPKLVLEAVEKVACVPSNRA